MTVSSMTTYLKYMQLQVVAEAFMTDQFGNLYLSNSEEFDASLVKGNTHAT